MLLPNVAKIVRDFLLDNTAVATLVDDRVHAYRTQAGYPLRTGDNARPWLLITPLLERSVTNAACDRTVNAMVQLEGYGRYLGDHDYARLIVATAHDELRDGLPAYSSTAGHVTSVLPQLGLQPQPDDEFGLARCTATVRVIAHPLVPVP